MTQLTRWKSWDERRYSKNKKKKEKRKNSAYKNREREGNLNLYSESVQRAPIKRYFCISVFFSRKKNIILFFIFLSNLIIRVSSFSSILSIPNASFPSNLSPLSPLRFLALSFARKVGFFGIELLLLNLGCWWSRSGFLFL